MRYRRRLDQEREKRRLCKIQDQEKIKDVRYRGRLCRIQDQERTKNLKYRRRLCRIQDYEKTKKWDTGEWDDEILRFSFCDALGLDSFSRCRNRQKRNNGTDKKFFWKRKEQQTENSGHSWAYTNCHKQGIYTREMRVGGGGCEAAKRGTVLGELNILI